MPTKELTTKIIDVEMILRTALKTPGIRVERERFLRKHLSKRFIENDVLKAIEMNPAQAGIGADVIDRIAKSCINYETSRVTGLSAAAGIPGGWFMAATVPADAIQFFAHVIRILQKLAYLYGWQELLNENDDELDDETKNKIILFMGVMFGVNAANKALAHIAGIAALNVPKKLIQQALTKTAVFQIVRKIASAIGAKMTKAIFAKGVGKIIPVVGAIASGGITLVFFKPMSNRLRKHLSTLPIASVDFYKESHKDDIIEVDFSDITDEDYNLEDGIDTNRSFIIENGRIVKQAKIKKK